MERSVSEHMEIRTERLLLRGFSEQDLDDLFELCSRDGVGEMAGWPAHRTIDETQRLLSQWVGDQRQFAVVLREEQKVIGYVALHDDSEEGREDTRELGCALDPDYQHQGYMAEALAAVVDHAFQTGVEYLWACCFQHNLPSKRLIEAAGFTFQQEGTFEAVRLGQTFPSYEYRMTKEEWLQRLR